MMYLVVDRDKVTDEFMPDAEYKGTDLGMVMRICVSMRNQQERDLVVIDEHGNVAEPMDGKPIGLNREEWEKRKARPNQPTEDSRVRAILMFLATLEHCFFEKRFGTVNQKNRPDITGCVVGWHFEFEVKRDDKAPEEGQAGMLEKWGNAGAMVGVPRSVDDVKAIFEKYGVDWRKLQDMKHKRVSAKLAVAPDLYGR